MENVNPPVEQEDVSLSELPAEPAPPIGSRFLFVDIAALRAKQLRRGARPRVADADVARLSHKAERVAMEEVRRGLVYYSVPGPQIAGLGGDGLPHGLDADASTPSPSSRDEGRAP